MSDFDENVVVIVRGLPGSGKTTLAKEISRNCGYFHFENDMFFETEKGYQYDASRLIDAQQWCFNQARDAIMAGKKIVVSNVFTKVSHMRDFLKLHQKTIVIECLGNFGSVHEIPKNVIEKMRKNWEPFAGAIQILD